MYEHYKNLQMSNSSQAGWQEIRIQIINTAQWIKIIHCGAKWHTFYRAMCTTVVMLAQWNTACLGKSNRALQHVAVICHTSLVRTQPTLFSLTSLWAWRQGIAATIGYSGAKLCGHVATLTVRVPHVAAEWHLESLSTVGSLLLIPLKKLWKD